MPVDRAHAAEVLVVRGHLPQALRRHVLPAQDVLEERQHLVLPLGATEGDHEQRVVVARHGGHPTPLHPRFGCRSDLWIAFQRLLSSRRFSGSSRISRARSSAWSLWKLSRRAGSSRPSSTAARTAQPGSLPWRQFVKRQEANSPLTSSKAASSPAPSDQSWISRRPGVSRRRAPPGRAISSRWVVVCRPRWSAARTSRVFCFSRPRSRLTRVRLADAGGAQERDRAAGREPRHERLQPLARLGRDREHRDAGGDGLDLGAAGVEVRAQVGLVEQHDREGPALPGEDERPLDPPRVEVPVEAHHEEDGVHVGGQHLGHRAVPGRAADEGGAPGQQGLDDRPLSRLARAQGHPVADGRQARGPARLVAQAPGHGRRRSPLLRVHAQDPGVAGDDAARHEAPGGEGREGLLEGGVEAERAESRPRQARQPRRARNSPMKPASAFTDSIGQAL